MSNCVHVTKVELLLALISDAVVFWHAKAMLRSTIHVQCQSCKPPAVRILINCWAAGAEALHVHLMAVNEIGMRLYESCGFELDQEESSNQAHYRGHCLDGIEGRGRTVLMRLHL
jgi:hypothetical protein